WDAAAPGRQPVAEEDERRLRILRPGHNCWRIERATRAAVLTNADYFRALAASLARARRSVLLLGWNLDARLMLDPPGAHPRCLALGDFLATLLADRPGLEIRVLLWDRPLVYGGNRTSAATLDALRCQCRGFDFRFVSPSFLAAHHQKIVVIDDVVA